MKKMIENDLEYAINIITGDVIQRMVYIDTDTNQRTLFFHFIKKDSQSNSIFFATNLFHLIHQVNGSIYKRLTRWKIVATGKIIKPATAKVAIAAKRRGRPPKR